MNSNIPVKIEFGGIDNVSTVLGNITLKLGGLNTKLDKTNELVNKTKFYAKISAFNSIIQNATHTADNVSNSIKSIIHDTSNIEDNINRLGILLNKKGDTKFFDEQKKQWRELSVISSHTQSEISDVAKEIVNSGVHNEEDLNALTNLSLKLADASKNDLTSLEAFTTINEFKNTYKIKAEDLSLLTDKIVYGKDQGTAGFHDILEGFKYASPVLSAVTNGSPDEFLALNAVLANHGIKGSNLGTALRRFPVQLVPKINSKFLKNIEATDGKEVSDIIKGMSGGHNNLLNFLGLTPDKITDEKGKIDLNKALILIKNNLEKYSITEQTGLIKQLFGQEAISAGITLKEFLNDYFEKLNKIKNESLGKADELSDSTRNTLEAKIKETKNAWDNFKISILQSGLDQTLNSYTDCFKDMLVYLNDMPPIFKQTLGITGLIGYGFIEVNAKLLPIILNLYLIHGLVTSASFIAAFGTIRTTIYGIAAATSAWTAATLANPMTWIAAGIAVGFGLLILYIDRIILHWDYLKDKSKESIDFMRDYFKKFCDDITLFFSKPEEAIKNLSKHFKEYLGFVYHSNVKTLKTITGIDEDPILEKQKTTREAKEMLADRNRINWTVPDYLMNKSGKQAKSEINLNINNAPEGSKIIQKAQGMPPVNIKMGVLGAINL
ncbi:MAG: phage tail tape measure protein [Silvanigrellaceae bacterium]|nr:phage tail tape measure protein [Silvanigrellaceae bacterium]